MNENPMTDSDVSADDRNLAMLAHLSALLGLIFSAGILVFLGPLVFWLIYKDRPEKAFIASQAKEALNFQISLALIIFVTAIAMMVLSIIPFIGWLIAALLGLGLLVLAIADFVLTIIAALKAKDGIAYRYPFTLRLFS
ncbi:hypothetical protein CO613_02740 [Lysobacteraceae bacterium NML07-0707]|nr:hypothetical protein CO613_02740 [Xanthomonadaceae bacterium NML07-0707]